MIVEVWVNIVVNADDVESAKEIVEQKLTNKLPKSMLFEIAGHEIIDNRSDEEIQADLQDDIDEERRLEKWRGL